MVPDTIPHSSWYKIHKQNIHICIHICCICMLYWHVCGICDDGKRMDVASGIVLVTQYTIRAQVPNEPTLPPLQFPPPLPHPISLNLTLTLSFRPAHNTAQNTQNPNNVYKFYICWNYKISVLINPFSASYNLRHIIIISSVWSGICRIPEPSGPVATHCHWRYCFP